jgi:hypothetical protein
MTEFQNFWRCEHHSSALENFFNSTTVCEWCRHTQELRWNHGGESPMPKSWSLPTAVHGLGFIP